MNNTALTLRRLGPDTAQDFATLLVTPPHGWCWCVAWETPGWEGWKDRSEKENQCLRNKLWDSGSYHGRIFYLEDRPVAWCRVGPRTEWPKLCATYQLEPVDSVYAFVCFGIAERHRGQGLMHQAMALALTDLAGEGVVEVEGFPRKKSLTDRLDPGEVWMGPARLFSSAGFEIADSRENVLHMRRKMVSGRVIGSHLSSDGE